MKKLKSKIMGFARNVKPFKNQIYQIPGLQTPKWSGKGVKPQQGAIMRHMNASVGGSGRLSRELQEKAIEEEKEQMEKEASSRFKTRSKTDIA